MQVAERPIPTETETEFVPEPQPTGERAPSRADNPPWMKALLLVFVIAPLIALGVAIWQLWQREVFLVDIVLLVVFYTLAQLGVTVGYHRYLTHRGFVAPTWLKFTLLVLGSMAIEGPALTWASTHLEHHAKSDREGDPHSPLDGFIHAHVGWIIDGFYHDASKYGHWLEKDRMVMFVSKTFPVWVTLGFLIPFLIDGWRGLIWGGIVRMVLVQHVTWSVNSICHTFGSRPFQTGDMSTNNWIVALLAGGEGWHNNHHAFQRSAFHGLHWWQPDTSGWVIRGLELLGVIKDVQRVTPEMMAKRRARGGASIEAEQPA